MLDVLATVQDLEHELRTQDNQYTSHAIFLVEEKRRITGLDLEYSENVLWWNGTTEEEVTRESDPARFQELEAVFDAGSGEPEDWTRTGYKDEWRFVQPFLTVKAAEEFRTRNAHRLGETRVFVDSGYRNTEWQLIRELFGGVLRRMLDPASQPATSTGATHVAP